MSVLVTGLLAFAPMGATTSAPGAVDLSIVSSAAPEERELERAPRADYWVTEWRRRWRVEHRANQQRARTIRRLRRTLSVRARAREVIPGVWLALASCESGQRWDYNGSSGFDGGLQFHPSTWSAYRRSGEPAFAYQASAYEQVQVAQRVLAAQGWQAWPACARKLGLR